VKTMQQAWRMEDVIRVNSDMMDKYDPKKRIALIVDEWGGWYETDPEGRGQLYQQNTIRDAMIAGLTLNIFNNHADRVRMANLAQMVNALQAVILTNEEKIILTPTYYVMEMYKIHQDAMQVPVQIHSNDFVRGSTKLQAVSVSASKDQAGKLHVSLTNIDNEKSQEVEIDLKGFTAKQVTGRILTSSNVQDHNTFDNPSNVVPKSFNGASISDGIVKVTMPPVSVIVLEVGS
jgi:alpha-L-arabinofuranosidase